MVKVGTSSVCDVSGHLHLAALQQLTQQLEQLHHRGDQVVLVSSGAVGAGLGRLGRSPQKMVDKQALAAIGQAVLVQTYQQFLPDITVGQVLVTRHDFDHDQARDNCLHTLQQLLQWRVLPIINENDTVADDELRIGDNDTLAARIAVLLAADLLVLLSDVDGLYTADPRRYAHAQRIAQVSWVNSEDIARYAGQAGQLGTGGMATKLEAARIAQNAGIPMVLAHSRAPDILWRIVSGQSYDGTQFLAQAKE
ncbi:MAG: glutamate 5-kinase [Firmicutes bacterium]|nr:glutamate 5-kinase [Bacillota bacterium]